MAVESPGLTDGSSEEIPPPPFDPPPILPPASAYAAPPYQPAPAPRRRRSLLWYSAVLVAIVVTLGAFGLLYIDDQSWQRQAGQLRQQNSSLQEKLTVSQAATSDAQQRVKDLQGQLQHPEVGLWNVPEKIEGPNSWLEGGIPDTFTYHLRATATGPMSVSILTFEQYGAAVDCMNNGGGTAYHCLNPADSVKSFIDVRSVSYDFHLAEGCAAYMAVWTSTENITVNPDVSVTYNPAPTFTGACG